MAYILTNKTAQTPLGFGALGVAIDPGQSLTITKAQADQMQEHPVIAGWVAEGKLHVQLVEDTAEQAAEQEAEAKRLVDEAAAEELRKKQETPELPKVPTPTPTAKK